MADDLKPPKSKFLRGQCTLNLETDEMHGNEHHVIIKWFEENAEKIVGMDYAGSLSDARLEDIKVKNQELEAENKGLLELLRKLQWCGAHPLAGYGYCSECGRTESAGHRDDCAVDNALKGEK